MSQYESVAKQTAEILRNRGYEAEECVVPKINTEKIGISVKLSNGCATVFYVEDDLTALEFADKICNQLTERVAIDIESFKVLNEEDVFPVLVRADWNKEILSQLPHREVAGDLAIYYVARKDFGPGRASAKITYAFAEESGFDEEDLYQLAMSNIRKMMTCADISTYTHMKIGPGMDVLTTNDAYLGAAVILAKAGDLDESSWLIPSSVHEWLIVDKRMASEEELCNMIKSINDACVLPEEVLSDHPYVVSDFVA